MVKKVVKRTKSGIKRAKQAKKRKLRNFAAKISLRKAFKAAGKAIKAKSRDAAKLVQQTISLIDKTAQRGIIHRNKAARQKSRLMLGLNKFLKG
jgi:small subunit ribosomal protein S20